MAVVARNNALDRALLMADWHHKACVHKNEIVTRSQPGEIESQ